MGTIWVRQFVGGLDGRRLPVTTSGGALIRLRDGHINRGGEIEQRARFPSTYSLPGGTVGLATTSDEIVVFGSSATPAGIPTGVTYQRLKHPTGESLEAVLSTDLVDDKVVAAARFADGSRYLYFDGERVPDDNWPAGRPKPSFVKTIRKQLRTISGSYAIRSGLLPTSPAGASDFDFVFDETDNPAAAVINMSTETGGAEKLKAMARYGDYIAYFAERTIQTWYDDPDPDLLRQVQTLSNTGTFAPLTVTQFGDEDIFYLDESGVRSLKARATTDAAFSSDIGNPIDDLVLADLAELTTDEREACFGLVEPTTGRFWLGIKDKVYVFSYFAGSKVSAWAEYRPGFTISAYATQGNKVYVRAGDTIYAYGGTGGTPDYSNVETNVWLPYLDANKPTQQKTWTGIDVACAGTWEVRVGWDPENLDASDKIATVTGTTYNVQRIEMRHEATHASLRFRLLDPPDSGPAKLGACVLHHNLDDEED